MTLDSFSVYIAGVETQSPLQRAADLLGSISALGRLCDVTPSAAQQWFANGVPAKHCMKIEEATEGKVTRYDLRPDVFGLAQKAGNEQAAA